MFSVASSEAAVCCKPDVSDGGESVLGFRIRPVSGAFILLAIMDIRPPNFILGKALQGSFAAKNAASAARRQQHTRRFQM